MRSAAGFTTRAPEGSLRRNVLIGAPVAAIFAATVLMIGPAAAAAAAVVVVVALVAIYHPMVITVLTFASAFTALPTSIPRALPIAGISVELYEILAVFAAAGLLLRTRKQKVTDSSSAVLAVLLVSASILSLATNTNAVYILYDGRRLFVLAIAIFVAGRAAWQISQAPRVYLRVLTAMMWISAALTALASTTGLDLGQRSLTASLEPGDDGSAVRLITSSTYLAVVVLCVCLYLYLRGALPSTAVVSLVLPSALIVALSFSRNPILALAVAAAAGLLHSRGAQSASRVARGLAISATALASLWALGLLDPSGGLNNWLTQQLSGLVDRVFAGSTGDALSTDKSTLYRTQQEDPYLWEAIRNSPFWGHGLGSPYKPEFTGRRYATPEIATAASRYAHNFFLWMTAKTGLLGLLIFLACTLRPTSSLFRPSSTPVFATALGAALLGMFMQSWVAPMPNGTPTALLFGALVGAAMTHDKQPMIGNAS
ncbi:O-antigen ligase family protein [Curtobacterium sp. MCPF17_050]|uniref:O-antigen ligase family protein n=1 Tax=Curtobacterium sp. MCPF17_050 TaxID=2175664 RepID=UPI0015E8DBD5|nr:O-antigen ligase family protein [Curtobacterium sp. MCPF17_050]WIB16066.1 O-antigen ligase family protein [Curtobacterium sp. MCPF17_050]